MFHTFEQSVMFFQQQKNLRKVPIIFYKFLKLDSDPHLKSSWIRIRKKWKRVNSPNLSVDIYTVPAVLNHC